MKLGAVAIIALVVLAKTYYGKLVTVAAASDNQRPELAHARAFQGGK